MMMTVKDVAKALGVSERSVWRWSSDGTLPPGVKIGGVVRWPRKSIEEWLAEREQDALSKQRAASEGAAEVAGAKSPDGFTTGVDQ